MPDFLLTHPRSLRELKFGDAAVRSLEALGSVVFNPGDEFLSSADLKAMARDCKVIVADRLTPADRGLFESLPELVALVRNAVDVRNIDLQAAGDHGVLVSNASAHFVDSMVELIVGQMVSLGRSFAEYAIQYRVERAVTPLMGTQLAGRVAGIIGLGQIGHRLAEVLRFMKLEVIGCDPVAAMPEGVAAVSLDELLARSDYVVCLPLHTPRNTGLCNAEFFAGMRRDAWFLNPSRGALVDEGALLDALKRGTIRGAALDVGTDVDDQPTLALGMLPNVVAMPHIGGLVEENIFGQAMDSVRQAGDIVAGRMPANALNAARATRFSRLHRNPTP